MFFLLDDSCPVISNLCEDYRTNVENSGHRNLQQFGIDEQNSNNNTSNERERQF